MRVFSISLFFDLLLLLQQIRYLLTRTCCTLNHRRRRCTRTSSDRFSSSVHPYGRSWSPPRSKSARVRMLTTPVRASSRSQGSGYSYSVWACMYQSCYINWIDIILLLVSCLSKFSCCTARVNCELLTEQ